ncbi:MAG: 16S rRNA (adenine(1518)-N(6)/adenine(1519)-N(6))-dimethyltransferase RsmA [Lachnospiraceae bacterium]|nr:16S rRNA (adenine(1518)-N(6)/adenine(1519)-N(6))-dimethyltransferase RsmA [Lachnospiraceae bacterium]
MTDNIYTPGGTLEIIKKYNFAIQKKYGQNFLVDGNVLDKIIDGAEITEEDCVIEIGPGVGAMTRGLAQRAHSVAAVEIDPMLIPILSETLDGLENVDIINGDILKFDIDAYISDNFGGKPAKVVANLPYYITTPIIMELLKKGSMLRSITVMIQKEVAQRMCAGPGTKDYGALSLAVQYYTKPVLIAEVPPTCFIPRPKVSSTVIRLELLDEKGVSVKDEELFFRLIRAAFNQRRKTLVNSIFNCQELDIGKDAVVRALNGLGLREDIRGEALTLEQFAELSDIIET